MNIHTEILEINVEEIREHKHNSLLFSNLNDELYIDLRENIRLHGILQPLLLTDDFTIICGHNRWKIAKELRYSKVPCKIVHGSHTEILELMISDNSLRRGTEKNILKLIEQAYQLSQIETVREGAISMGIKKSKFERLKKLYNLIDEFKDLLADKNLTLGAGYELATKDAETQMKYYQKLRNLNKICENDVKNLENSQELYKSSWNHLKKKVQKQNNKYLSDIRTLLGHLNDKSKNEAQNYINLLTAILTENEKEKN